MGVAIAVKEAGLHKRLALGILVLTGTGKKSLLLSFMFITATLSMFICNTATTAMMIPILTVGNNIQYRYFLVAKLED